MQALLDWLVAHQTILRWMVGLSIVSAVATLVALPILIARIRADYFLTRTAPPDAWSARHPAVRITVKVIKNLVGVVLLISGLWMLVLPGQGILTILVGVTLLDFPGKRRMELGIVRRRGVLRAMNWIRRKSSRPPLELPPPEPTPR